MHADVTELLAASRDGDAEATDQLMAAVYDELRQIAAAHRVRHDVGDTLSATSLVHECYLKLVDGDRLPFEGRAHFFGAAARAIRQVIIDAARSRARDKRGGGVRPVPLDEAPYSRSTARSGGSPPSTSGPRAWSSAATSPA